MEIRTWRLVQERVVGGLGEEPVEGGKRAEQVLPERFIVIVAEQVRQGAGGDPRVPPQLAFELTGSPSGVADEGADEGAGALGMPDRLFCGEAERPAESLVVTPPEGGKSELIAIDGTAVIDREVSQRAEIFIRQQLADEVAGGVVENQSQGAFIGRKLGEKDDGAVENPVTEGRIGQEELTVEKDRRIGWIGCHARKVDVAGMGCKLQHTNRRRRANLLAGDGGRR